MSLSFTSRQTRLMPKSFLCVVRSTFLTILFLLFLYRIFHELNSTDLFFMESFTNGITSIPCCLSTILQTELHRSLLYEICQQQHYTNHTCLFIESFMNGISLMISYFFPRDTHASSVHITGSSWRISFLMTHTSLGTTGSLFLSTSHDTNY